MWRIDYCGWLVFLEFQVEMVQDENVSPLNRYVLLVFSGLRNRGVVGSVELD